MLLSKEINDKNNRRLPLFIPLATNRLGEKSPLSPLAFQASLKANSAEKSKVCDREQRKGENLLASEIAPFYFGTLTGLFYHNQHVNCRVLDLTRVERGKGEKEKMPERMKKSQMFGDAVPKLQVKVKRGQCVNIEKLSVINATFSIPWER